MLTAINETLIILAAVLVICGAYFASTHQWNRLTVTVFYFNVIVFIISHVLPIFFEISTVYLADPSVTQMLIGMDMVTRNILW